MGLLIVASLLLTVACDPVEPTLRQPGQTDDAYLTRKIERAVEAKATPLDALDFVGREPAADSANFATEYPDTTFTPDTQFNDALPDFATARHVMYWKLPSTRWQQFVIGMVWPATGDPVMFRGIVTP